MAGQSSSGNKTVGSGKAEAGQSSSGNKTVGSVKVFAGQSSSGSKATGKVKAEAGSASSGNRSSGHTKRSAGIRSGMKRKSRHVLVIKPEWLRLILCKQKVWELRGKNTLTRGPVHLGASGAGGVIIGCAKLTDSRVVSRDELQATFEKHRVADIDALPYKTVWAWELSEVQEFDKPLRFQHTKGAIVWVNLKP